MVASVKGFSISMCQFCIVYIATCENLQARLSFLEHIWMGRRLTKFNTCIVYHSLLCTLFLHACHSNVTLICDNQWGVLKWVDNGIGKQWGKRMEKIASPCSTPLFSHDSWQHNIFHFVILLIHPLMQKPKTRADRSRNVQYRLEIPFWQKGQQSHFYWASCLYNKL